MPLPESTGIPLAPPVTARDPQKEAILESEIVTLLQLVQLQFQARGNAKASRVLQLLIPDFLTAWPRYMDAINGPVKAAAASPADLIRELFAQKDELLAALESKSP